MGAGRDERATCIAVCAPGLEEAAATELRELLGGAGGVRRMPQPGAVRFEAGPAEVARVHAWARTVVRVWVSVAAFRASSWAELEAGVGRIPWERWLPAGAPVEVRAAAHRSRLYHTGAIAQRVAGVLDGLGGPRGSPQAALQRILVRLERDRCSVRLDATGPALYVRGTSEPGGAAPLRETTAAALLRLAGWRPGVALVDPFCGTGTIPIEAAAWALGAPMAWGHRPFARWPAWAGALAGVGAAQRVRVHGEVFASIVGADASPQALALARASARRAGVEAVVRFEQASAVDLEPPPGEAPGIVVTNPPWGCRMGRRGQLRATYHRWGDALRARWRGWQVAVLCGDDRLVAAMRLDLERVATVHIGGRLTGVWRGRVW